MICKPTRFLSGVFFMELGEKLRQARLEAGLSQRQLCGDEITRNMLSQIEHGTARPSMKTLQFLAERLGKNVSYFLEETVVVSPNQQVMISARRLYDGGNYAEAALALEAYHAPDTIFDRERELLWVLVHLALAEQALRENRDLYAQELLEKADLSTHYCQEALQRRRLLLLGSIRGHSVTHLLPSLDEELLLRSGEALSAGDDHRAAALLDAAQDHSSPRWFYLRGEAYLKQGAYEEAARCFHRAEDGYPRETTEKLEHCYRELGDYKRAYEYACKQKA